jgi:hypothetical protein
MKNLSFMRQMGFAVIALIGLITLSSTANAQYGNNNPNCSAPQYNNQSYNNNSYNNYNQTSQIALTNGYQLGYGNGSNDRAYRSAFDIQRSKSYRDADSGYSGQSGSKDAYKQAFRQGFELGYQDGYSGSQRRTFNGYNDYNYNNSSYRNQNRNHYDNQRRNNRRYGNRY